MSIPFINKQPFILLSLFSLALLTFAENAFSIDGPLILEGTLLVDAQANIYSAGKTVPLAPAGGGAGVLPPVISFPVVSYSSETMTLISFPKITGQISCCDPPLYNDANGGEHALGSTIVQPVDNLSGITHDKTMFLVGVFTSETIMSSAPPPSLNYIGADEKSLIKPELNQVFLIGDGNAGEQYFQMPFGANQLFLGFIDSDQTERVGFYQDNLGELSVEFAIYENPTPPKLFQGLIAHYTFEENAYYDEKGNRVLTDLADSSGFNFHAKLPTDQAQERVNFNIGQYQQGLVFENEAGIQFRISNLNTGIPMRGNWTIATWFAYPKTPDVSYEFIVSSPRLTLAIRCSEIAIRVVNDEIGTTGCPEVQPQFYGSGFLMSTLSEGWHHLAAVAKAGHTTFYIDGLQVGQSAYQSKPRISILHGKMSLNDFRIYNRALLPNEIQLLSGNASTTPEPGKPSTTTDNCLARYDEGKLSLPCITVPTPLGEKPLLYEAEMAVMPETNPMQFILKAVREVE